MWVFEIFIHVKLELVVKVFTPSVDGRFPRKECYSLQVGLEEGVGRKIKVVFGQNTLKDRRCLEGFKTVGYHFRGDVERHG